MPRRTREPLEELDNLTRTQVQSIHKAFANASTSEPPPTKRRKLNESPSASSAPGGFLPEPQSAGGFLPEPVPAGGFMSIDDPEPSPVDLPEYHDYMPLSRVPYALAELGLPYDAEVLATFEQGADSDQDDNSGAPARISKDTFLQICAVLIAGESSSQEEEEPEPDFDFDQEQDDASEFEDQRGSSESEMEQGINASENTRRPRTRAAAKRDKGKGRAVESDAALTDIEEDENGVAASTKKSSAKRTKRPKATLHSRPPLSAAQEAYVATTFKSFFPDDDIDDDDISGKSIGVENIKQVLGLIQKTLTDAEITEMLEYATKAAELRVGLDGFEQIMRDIKAV